MINGLEMRLQEEEISFPLLVCAIRFLARHFFIKLTLSV
jgi:hypothetical protein